MDSTLILSVVVGMSVGLALLISFASMTFTDGKSFRPDGDFDWSPEDGGLPRLWLADETGAELNENPFGSPCNDPDMC